jgi:hypothetical protein
MLAYWFWILGAVISMMALFVFQRAINALWPAIGGSPYAMRAVDRFPLVFMGLVWLVNSIFTEHLLRSAITDVRVRRFKARIDPGATLPPEPKSALMRHLRKIGLDILARRVVFAIGVPTLMLGAAYGLQRLAFVLLAMRSSRIN